jgi:pimeloyl-ACP methyl ester carboxylesterase
VKHRSPAEIANSAPISQMFRDTDPSVRETVVSIVAGDGVESRGILYRPINTQPRTVIVWSHPTGDMLRWWMTPYWSESGFASFAYTTRYVNNAMDCILERCLLDVAGVIKYLRDACGFENIILLGKSNGASLFSYYQAEASTPVGQRVPSPPGGNGPNLNDHELASADGLIIAAGNPGQGVFLQSVIDPSVVDEADPLASDPTLDMYDERNGFKSPPEVTLYDRAWLEDYREAQRARVARLDAVALAALTRADSARQTIARSGFAAMPSGYRNQIERQAEFRKVMVIYRTAANPAYADLTIDPSDRDYGSIQSQRLDLHNYGLPGFARVVTANCWLSTWSCNWSNGMLERNLPKVTLPTYFICPSADEDLYPSLFKRQAEDSGAEDKELCWLTGFNHNLVAPGKASPNEARRHVMDLLINWTKRRFSSV